MKVGKFTLDWLKGGTFHLDGGPMFGVVPKVLWQKKYPANEQNQVKLLADPILVRAGGTNIVIETGLGNKLADKQKKIFAVTEEWAVPESLEKLGLTRHKIDYVVLTHCDFDHAGGAIMYGPDGQPELTFPNATYVTRSTEWQDAHNPNIRSKNTYWEKNFSLLTEGGNLKTVDGPHELLPGFDLIPTGGHTRGHQIVRLHSEGQTAYHLADLLPDHAHANPLWIMAYDNYPMDVIEQKEKFLADALKENAWFFFYHDPFMRASKFDEKGQVTEKVEIVL